MLSSFYKHIVKPLFFKLDPEVAHHLALTLAGNKVTEALTSLLPQNVCSSKNLKVKALGLEFKNPVGVAAGVDKDCIAPIFFANCGFSHIELGTVTMVPQIGNPKPRMFRYPEINGLVNRMGFPNDGVEKILTRLKKLKANPSQNPSLENRMIIGVNIGKSKDTSIDLAHNDYRELFKLVKPYSDYITINVSSPNTPDLRKLQEKVRLKELFSSLNEINQQQVLGKKVPFVVKVAPDLTWQELDEIIEVCLEMDIAGMVATNTLIDRTGLPDYLEKVGGFSGTPNLKRTVSFIKHISIATKNHKNKETGEPFIIIACGGISTADHVKQIQEAGAQLVQMYTGLVYEGPFVVRDICRGDV